MKQLGEPSIRELASEFEGFKELMTERDRRYEQRFEAMDEKTSLALTSSEKAVAKAEIATEKRFDSVNEFRGTLSDQAANLLPRLEANAKFSSYDEKFDDMKKEIAGLRESRSAGTGEKSGTAEAQHVAITAQQRQQWLMSLIIGIVLFVAGIFLARAWPTH